MCRPAAAVKPETGLNAARSPLASLSGFITAETWDYFVFVYRTKSESLTESQPLPSILPLVNHLFPLVRQLQ